MAFVLAHSASPPARSVTDRRAAVVDLTGFAAVHTAAVIGVLAVGAPGPAVAVGVVSYVVRCWGVVAGFHRYFSHRTYRLGRISQFLVAVIGTLAMQKGVLWWVATHRAHHAHADTARDPHSPRHRGLAYSHCGWLFDPARQAVDEARVADWAGYPELQWLQRHRAVPVTLFGAGLWLVTGPAGFVWGFAVSSVLLWHALLASGSLAHRPSAPQRDRSRDRDRTAAGPPIPVRTGRRPFPTPDDSRNCPVLAALLLGDGWHNNHHRWPTSARQGRSWREPDPVYRSLQILAFLGVAWGLRTALPASGDPVPPAGSR